MIFMIIIQAEILHTYTLADSTRTNQPQSQLFYYYFCTLSRRVHFVFVVYDSFFIYIVMLH